MYIQMQCVVWQCVFADSLISIFTAHKMPLHEDSDSVVSGRGDGVVDDEVTRPANHGYLVSSAVTENIYHQLCPQW